MNKSDSDLEKELLEKKEAKLASLAEQYHKIIEDYNTLAEQIRSLRAILGMDTTVEDLSDSGLMLPASKSSAPKARKKPGRKAKAAPKKMQAKAPKRGPKTKQVPRLIDAIQIVMGSSTVTATEVHTELKKRHWLPNSDDPLGYIRYTLSANKDIFLRVEGQRGHYYLDDTNSNCKKSSHDEAKSETPKAKPEVKKAAEPVPEPEGTPAPVAKPKAVRTPRAAKVAVRVEPKTAPPAEAVTTTSLGPESPEAIVDSILSQTVAAAFS